MKKLVSSLVVLCTTVLFAGLAFGAPSHADRLKGPFASGSDVTKACLQCHDQQAKDFMKTVHWTWSTTQDIPGKGKNQIGNKNAINGVGPRRRRFPARRVV